MRLNIRKLENERKKLNLSMSAFSRRFRLTDSTYSKMLLSQSTTLKTLTQIAKVLRIDPKDLLLR